MNLFTKRFGLVLAGVVGVGAIAALAIGASFALFTASTTGGTQTFTAGTVSLGSPVTGTCTTDIGNLEPGDTGSCPFTVDYSGSLPAYIGAQVTSATATGGLDGVLEYTINNLNYTAPNPILIGNTDVSGAGPYTATLYYTLPLDATNVSQGKSITLNLTFVAVQCSYNGLNSDGTLSNLPNDNCALAPASWSQTPAATPSPVDGLSIVYDDSYDNGAACDFAFYPNGGISPCFYPNNVAPGGNTALNLTVENDNEYADATVELQWPTAAGLTFDSQGDGSASCASGTSGTNTTETCTFTDFSHQYKSDTYNFTVSGSASAGPITVQIFVTANSVTIDGDSSLTVVG